jgi:glutamyl-tRNA reductase
MKIEMTGIDFNKASIEYREKFALTKSGQLAMLKDIAGRSDVSSCVIINTCNRMELWVSYDGDSDKDPYDILCQLFNVDTDTYRDYFTYREDMEAVMHLFELACGLKSKVFGEEQILSQVKESICIARECRAVGPVLEALFRYAVTAAKKVKTQVRLTAVDSSVARIAVRTLKAELGDLKGLNCLVIGNGEMGRLAAKGLVAEGCEVIMTLRQYKSGDAVIPRGCKVIDYEERYSHLSSAKVVISATRSPHYTLYTDNVREFTGNSIKLLFDLALPRDIEPSIAKLPNIRLYDIDDLGGSLVDEADNESIADARAIINDEINEFERWCNIRNLLPKIGEISTAAAVDAENRIRKSMKNLDLDAASQNNICEAAGRSINKVVENIMFSLQKNVDSEIWDACFQDKEASPDDESAAADLNELPPRFPLFIDLSGKKIAVIGAGSIAYRRIMSLLTFPCNLKVAALWAREEIEQLNDEGKISLKLKAYEPSDIEGAFLVVAATDDRQLNHCVAQDAEKNGQHCSVVDCKEECTFYFPAIAQYHGGVIGICGTGDDHTRTKEMSASIKKFISEKESI